MVLETSRLILRPWEEGDAEECYRYAKDPQVGLIAGWPPHRSVEDSLQAIRNMKQGSESYAVVWKETGSVIGSITLVMPPYAALTERKDECELSYWLGPPFWGKGIVVEAANVLLQRAFQDLNCPRVWSAYYEGNQRSRRVQEKLGFRYIWTRDYVYIPALNETREEHVSCITRAEWENALLEQEQVAV